MNKHRQLYLDIVRRTVCGLTFRDVSMSPWNKGVFDEEVRNNGTDWPTLAHTMIGHKRLLNIENLCKTIIEENITGDFVETGVWRGGACIFMNAILEAYEITDKKIWVCDSFQGLPPPDPKYEADNGDIHYQLDEFLSIPLEKVQQNFQDYNLLNDRVMFVQGFFKYSMPLLKETLEKEGRKISLLRLDGDMYESTMNVLENLYPLVVDNGYIIIDDYILPNCRAALSDYFKDKKEMMAERIDEHSVFWRKNEV